MGIISNITGIFHHPDTGINAKDKKEPEKDSELKTGDVVSKEASSAIEARAKGGIEADKHIGIKPCSTKKLTGTIFPDVDTLEICKRYIDTKKEAKDLAYQTTRKIIKAFKTGEMETVYDDKGNIKAIFSKGESTNDDNYTNQDNFCSYKMAEYDPDTKELKAITRIYNHNAPGFDWNKHSSPYMERFEFSRNPKENTYLRVGFSKKLNQKGTTGLVPNVEIYAKGYETDGKLFGLRKADTYLSTILYKGYDSYRENYSSPDRIFNGSINYESPSITEQGGLEEENFTGAIEYPTEQMKFGDEIMFINFPYVFKKKD